MSGVLGWDIGGVNTKVARVERGEIVRVASRVFEIQREPQALRPLLVELARAAGVQPGDAHAVTMTAELSQAFRTKREGVAFVVDQVVTAFPGAWIRLHTVDGRFVDAGTAMAMPLAVAAANWAAAARRVALAWPDAVFLDVGSTTTDITPIVNGRVASRGRTDPERLRESELVYSGALRTPAEALAPSVPVRDAPTGVAAEGFALAGDVYVWRGDLTPNDYSVPTPDGRPPTREFAGERLARLVCADREMLDDDAITAIADSLWEAQVQRIARAIRRIVRRHPSLARGSAVAAGLGHFLAAEAARRSGLQVAHLAERWGDAARHAPAAAVALLLAVRLETETIER